jgi:pimeloyl-ACP methyl ester carboxylesterase
LLEAFSPKTLNDDQVVKDWIDTFMMWPRSRLPESTQHDIAPVNNRLPAYRAITARVLLIGFADDVVMPPHLGAEVADALPNGRPRGPTRHAGVPGVLRRLMFDRTTVAA